MCEKVASGNGTGSTNFDVVVHATITILKTTMENYNQEYKKNVCQAIIWTNLYTKYKHKKLIIEL
jgi:hypothetical protein